MSDLYENIKVGADPELFLINDWGKFISSVGLVGGTKQSPLPVDGYGNCLQEDNVSVEFNIAPASNKQEFTHNLDMMLNIIQDRMRAFDLTPAIVASAVFDYDQLQTEQAREFGCEPDFNAWTGEVNPHPHCDNEQLRSAGGHIHVGFDNPTQTKKMKLIRAMDVFLGVPSIEFDKDQDRRKLYGGPGAFRPKNYGAEYRTLSNFWISTKELQEWAYDQTMKAIKFLNNGGEISFTDEPFVRKAIINQDHNSFVYLKERYGF